MADCSDAFHGFYNVITLCDTKCGNLKQARSAVRNKIRKHFGEVLKRQVPKFHTQGSQSMLTTVNPIDGEYDIDDGVYLQCIDNNIGNWPTPETVHGWVLEAVKGHTDTPPKDKRTCIRVIYKGQYHLDLPIYGVCLESIYLAEKGEAGWHRSDPKAVTEWFAQQVSGKGEQLRNVVKYIKAWADFQSKSIELPSSIILTILVSENFIKNDRDDVAFSGTIRNIIDRVAYTQITNPVDRSEILSNRLTEAQKINFRNSLVALVGHCSEALREKNKENACKIWQKEFGDRFPIIKDEKTMPLKTSAPAILRDDARSACSTF